MNTINGLPVRIVQPSRKMTVSASFRRIQDPELVAKTDAWMESFFGYVEQMPDGVVYRMDQSALELKPLGFGGGGRNETVLLMNQNTYNRLKAAGIYGSDV